MPTYKFYYICPPLQAALLSYVYSMIKWKAKYEDFLHLANQNIHLVTSWLSWKSFLYASRETLHENTSTLPDLMAAILKGIRILASGLYSQQNRMPKSTTSAFHVASADKDPKKKGNSAMGSRPVCFVKQKTIHPTHVMQWLIAREGLILWKRTTCGTTAWLTTRCPNAHPSFAAGNVRRSTTLASATVSQPNLKSQNQRKRPITPHLQLLVSS